MGSPRRVPTRPIRATPILSTESHGRGRLPKAGIRDLSLEATLQRCSIPELPATSAAHLRGWSVAPTKNLVSPEGSAQQT